MIIIIHSSKYGAKKQCQYAWNIEIVYSPTNME